MARYFFHLAMGADDRDQEGVELDSLDEARRIGVKFLAQTLLDHADAFWISPEWRRRPSGAVPASAAQRSVSIPLGM